LTTRPQGPERYGFIANSHSTNCPTERPIIRHCNVSILTAPLNNQLRKMHKQFEGHDTITDCYINITRTFFKMHVSSRVKDKLQQAISQFTMCNSLFSETGHERNLLLSCSTHSPKLLLICSRMQHLLFAVSLKISFTATRKHC
jgi:hypothetical protein